VSTQQGTPGIYPSRSGKAAPFGCFSRRSLLPI
jgi:hypothetical protein